MSLAKYFFVAILFLFGGIAVIGWLKKGSKEKPSIPIVQEISIPQALPKEREDPVVQKAPSVEERGEDLPEADRIHQLFALDSSKLPFVETVSYASRVPWLKGRPAWIADYATHFATSRHFIARSLNRKPDYFTQKVSPGDRFNVFRTDKNINFYLLIDLSRCKMWFYALDIDANERMLLKTYKVGVGRLDPKRESGSLTPVGKYVLGEKVAIYKSGTMGFFQDQKTEMIRIFGTRWLPFEKELEGCSEPARGLGIHGAPWEGPPSGGELVEDLSKIGAYDSDGCIRLASQDIEEIFAIVLTKPTIVELVKDFHDAKLPGVEGTIVKPQLQPRL